MENGDDGLLSDVVIQDAWKQGQGCATNPLHLQMAVQNVPGEMALHTFKMQNAIHVFAVSYSFWFKNKLPYKGNNNIDHIWNLCMPCQLIVLFKKCVQKTHTQRVLNGIVGRHIHVQLLQEVTCARKKIFKWWAEVVVIKSTNGIEIKWSEAIANSPVLTV